MDCCCILRAVKKRILVVEDDHALARVLADNLSYSGFDVATIEGGPEVLSTVRTFGPDFLAPCGRDAAGSERLRALRTDPEGGRDCPPPR